MFYQTFSVPITATALLWNLSETVPWAYVSLMYLETSIYWTQLISAQANILPEPWGHVDAAEVFKTVCSLKQVGF